MRIGFLLCSDVPMNLSAGRGGASSDSDPFVRGGNVHGFTILRHGASRYWNSRRFEQVSQLGVRKWLARVLVVDQAADHRLDGGAGCFAAALGIDARGEEIGRAHV